MKDAPPLRSTDRSLPIALLRAREVVMEPIREMLAQSQISEQKWRVLRVVDEAGPIEQTAIAQSACLLLPSLTRLLHAMEKDGWITRQASETDRRKTLVTLTEAGRALIARHAAQSNALFEQMEAEYGAEKLTQLLDLLEDLQRLGK